MTVYGVYTKRPDIVLYVNGIALGVLELKRSIVSVSEGIRQNLDSQKKEFIRPFYTTVQLVMAGNDTEGLRYGVIETPGEVLAALEGGRSSPERPGTTRCFGSWASSATRNDCSRSSTTSWCSTQASRRPAATTSTSVYAQRRIGLQRREGGIIWHTQGSGKSLTMVWLAKWIREHVPGRAGADHHRPYRTGRADREGLQGCKRGHIPHEEWRRPGAGSE